MEKPAVVAEMDSPEGETDISDSETDDTHLSKRGGSANSTRNIALGVAGVYCLGTFAYNKFAHGHSMGQGKKTVMFCVTKSCHVLHPK